MLRPCSRRVALLLHLAVYGVGGRLAGPHVQNHIDRVVGHILGALEDACLGFSICGGRAQHVRSEEGQQLGVCLVVTHRVSSCVRKTEWEGVFAMRDLFDLSVLFAESLCYPV